MPPTPYQDVVCVNQNVGPIREADLAAVQDVIRTVPQVWIVCVGCPRCRLLVWGVPGVDCLCGVPQVWAVHVDCLRFEVFVWDAHCATVV